MDRFVIKRERITKFVGTEEFRQQPLQLTRAVFAEMIGTAIVVLLWTGTARALEDNYSFDYKIALSLTVGFIVAAMIVVTDWVSGGHLNPCVTVGFLFAGKISFLRALAYFVFQCWGGILGAAVLYGISPLSGGLNGTNVTHVTNNATNLTHLTNLTSLNNITTSNDNETFSENSTESLGRIMETYDFAPADVTQPSSDISLYQAVGVEFLASLVLVLTYLVVQIEDLDRDNVRGRLSVGPVVIGFTMAACHLAFTSYTGPGMNPARSFGPAVIHNYWEYHWIYWVGPLLGSVVAAMIYTLVFAPCPFVREERNRKNPEAQLDIIELELETSEVIASTSSPPNVETTDPGAQIVGEKIPMKDMPLSVNVEGNEEVKDNAGTSTSEATKENPIDVNVGPTETAAGVSEREIK